LRHILFLDIETSSQFESYDHLPESLKPHWRHKMRYLRSAEEYPTDHEEFSALYHDKAAIYAEFGKIICISVGFVYQSDKNEKCFKVKSFASDDERLILDQFHHLLNEHYYDRHNQYLCGHNIKEFDIPYICRRSLIHQLSLPNLLQISGYKPWQVQHLLDTLELWKFGDYKHYTSLGLLCEAFNIESPKGDMDGSMVSTAYWSGGLEKIVEYCQKDVIATALVYLKCRGLEIFDQDKIEIIH